MPLLLLLNVLNLNLAATLLGALLGSSCSGRRRSSTANGTLASSLLGLLLRPSGIVVLVIVVVRAVGVVGDEVVHLRGRERRAEGGRTSSPDGRKSW